MEFFNFLWAQGLIEVDQLINLQACIKVNVVGESPSDNNSTVSCSLCVFRPGCVAPHFYCIVVDPDSLSVIGSDIVEYNVRPSTCVGNNSTKVPFWRVNFKTTI